ncbi:transposable element Tcb1 transposase [Trichonephila clavipes]|nr:transposable element Tcb1 transposase [Trichonephila clavipes]
MWPLKGAGKNRCTVADFSVMKTPNQELWSGVSFCVTTGPLWSSIETSCSTAVRHDILRSALLPLLLQHPCLVFQQDNARPHTARVYMNCFTTCQILPFPSRSPDLFPIDHMMGRRLHAPENADDLTQQLEQIWHEVRQEIIRVLYHSMPRSWLLAARLEVGQHLIDLVTL